MFMPCSSLLKVLRHSYVEIFEVVDDLKTKFKDKF